MIGGPNPGVYHCPTFYSSLSWHFKVFIRFHNNFIQSESLWWFLGNQGASTQIDSFPGYEGEPGSFWVYSYTEAPSQMVTSTLFIFSLLAFLRQPHLTLNCGFSQKLWTKMKQLFPSFPTEIIWFWLYSLTYRPRAPNSRGFGPVCCMCFCSSKCLSCFHIQLYIFSFSIFVFSPALGCVWYRWKHETMIL